MRKSYYLCVIDQRMALREKTPGHALGLNSKQINIRDLTVSEKCIFHKNASGIPKHTCR